MAKPRHAGETIGMFRLPNRPRRIVADVVPNCGELARGEGEHEPEAPLPKDGGCCPPSPPGLLLRPSGGCRGLGGGAPVPCGLLHEAMGENERLKARIFVEIHYQHEVHMVGHDNPVAGRKRRITGVQALEYGYDRLAGWQQLGVYLGIAAPVQGTGGCTPRAPWASCCAHRRAAGGSGAEPPSLDNPRKHRLPPLHAEGEEEELAAMPDGSEKKQIRELIELNDEAYGLIDDILGPPEEDGISVEEMLRQFPASRKGRAN